MRRFGAGVLVVVSTVLLVMASFGWWADRDILDSKRFSSNGVEVLQQPSVQDALTAFITERISDDGSSRSRRIPGVSVSRISFSACRAAASSPATVSALMLWAWPSRSAATEEITGM